MVMFYNLQVGKYLVKYSPLNADESEYPYCDKEGNILKRVTEGENNQIKYFADEKGNKHEIAFRLINNKPFAKLDKTKVVTTFKEVDRKEVEDLLSEKEYLVECDFLRDELINTGKALKFGFTNGNGFKVYKAYIYVDTLYNLLFMKLGRTQKSELLNKISQDLQNKKQIEQLNLTIQGIEKAKVEDLISI